MKWQDYNFAVNKGGNHRLRCITPHKNNKCFGRPTQSSAMANETSFAHLLSVNEWPRDIYSSAICFSGTISSSHSLFSKSSADLFGSTHEEDCNQTTATYSYVTSHVSYIYVIDTANIRRQYEYVGL